MRAILDCIPCLQMQALRAMKICNADAETSEALLRKVMGYLEASEWGSTPPELAHGVHRILREKLDPDPYSELKKKYNQIALEMYPKLKKIVENSPDPLETAAKIAIAGNVIDFGAFESFDLDKTLSEMIANEDTSDVGLLKKKIADSKSMLYFFDNSGEIVFDRLLIEELEHSGQFEKITLVAKGGPILNDATIEDVKAVGLYKGCYELRFTGNGDPGTGPERNSEEVRGWIDSHDLIISKGQGNYEALNEVPGIFFLLLAKCPIVAATLNMEKGSPVLKYNGMVKCEKG